MLEVVFDALRVLHMASFAVGIGTAAFLELQVMKRFQTRIDSEGLQIVLTGHKLIFGALVTLWATGLCLMTLRIGFLGGDLSVKILAKLWVVTLLTLNMRVIESFVIPELYEVEGMALGDIPRRIRSRLGAVAGFSGGCWLTALLIGGMTIATEMSASGLTLTVGTILLAAICVGALAGRYASQAPEFKNPMFARGKHPTQTP